MLLELLLHKTTWFWILCFLVYLIVYKSFIGNLVKCILIKQCNKVSNIKTNCRWCFLHVYFSINIKTSGRVFIVKINNRNYFFKMFMPLIKPTESKNKLLRFIIIMKEKLKWIKLLDYNNLHEENYNFVSL